MRDTQPCDYEDCRVKEAWQILQIAGHPTAVLCDRHMEQVDTADDDSYVSVQTRVMTTIKIVAESEVPDDQKRVEPDMHFLQGKEA